VKKFEKEICIVTVGKNKKKTNKEFQVHLPDIG